MGRLGSEESVGGNATRVGPSHLYISARVMSERASGGLNPTKSVRRYPYMPFMVDDNRIDSDQILHCSKPSPLETKMHLELQGSERSILILLYDCGANHTRCVFLRGHSRFRIVCLGTGPNVEMLGNTLLVGGLVTTCKMKSESCTEHMGGKVKYM